MKIYLGPIAWKKLGLDKHPERLPLVRAAFYLGYGLIRIERLVQSAPNDPEPDSIINTAEFLGLTEEDTVEFDASVFP